MPELPEVQTVVDDLLAMKMTGRKIKRVRVFWPATACFSSQRQLDKAFKDKRINRIYRRGKLIVFELEDGLMAALHLRMSGRLRYVKSKEPRLKHEHLCITLQQADQLRFHDPRKFGRIYFGPAAENKLKALGLEPLDSSFNTAKLAALVLKRQRLIKPLLLDQSMIAGLGNICVDEALYAARVHPLRISNTLKQAEAHALHQSILAFLKKAILNGGTSLGKGEQNFVSVSQKQGNNKVSLNVYGRAGQPCKICGGMIKRMIVGQRGTYLCPACQGENA